MTEKLDRAAFGSLPSASPQEVHATALELLTEHLRQRHRLWNEGGEIHCSCGDTFSFPRVGAALASSRGPQEFQIVSIDQGAGGWRASLGDLSVVRPEPQEALRELCCEALAKDPAVIAVVESIVGRTSEIADGEMQQVRRNETDGSALSELRPLEQSGRAPEFRASAQGDSHRPPSAARSTADASSTRAEEEKQVVSSSRSPTPDPPTIDPAIMALAEKVLRRDRTMTFPGEAYRLAAAFKEAVSAFRGSVTRPPEPQGWRDIESAPRNYESVLLCAAHTRTVREGYWSTESKAWQTLICEGPNDLLWTHWMPLPGPPKDGSQ